MEAKKSFRIGGIFNNYQDYLISDMWKEKRKLIFEQRAPNCEICGVKKTYFETITTVKKYKYRGREITKYITRTVKKGKPLIVHHLHYNSVCNEKSEDLMILCRDCHKEVHKNDKTL